MKLHLPLLLRAALVAAACLPVHAILEWNGGDWNTEDFSWLENGVSTVFSQGDAVLFSVAAESTMVNITAVVNPASMVVNGSGYVFIGNGGIAGAAALSLESGATLSVQNANSFSGGTTLQADSALTLGVYNGVGSVSDSELALGDIQGTGRLVIELADAAARASIQGNSLAGFTGTLCIERGNLGLGRRSDHAGAGSKASLGASVVEVGGGSAFIVSLGGGRASLDTGNSISPEIRTENGSIIGNRDGHVNWLGNVQLNKQDVTATIPGYDSAASTELSLYYGKYVVWNGVVSGDGVLRVTSGTSDSGADHRLVLTNGANTFQGTYQLAGPYLTTLALAGAGVSSAAGVELLTANSRLVLMSTSAVIRSLNGASGLVQAEGSGDLLLTVEEGDFSGVVRDSATPAAGLSLGLFKTGSAALLLNGENCTYTGKTLLQGGSLQFSGNTSLGSISVGSAAARLITEGTLSLQSGASLSFNMDGANGAMLQAGGSFAISGESCAVQLSGYENLAPGSYKLASWESASPVTTEDFVALGVNDTAAYTYSVQVQGNSLALVVADTGAVPWLWDGGSATWSDTSTAQWANATSGEPAGQNVTFSVRNAGTVTIDQVTPAGISVVGGEYTFTAASAASPGIVSNGTLRISGDATVLNLNLDNASFTGDIALNGGVLQLGAEKALGGASLYFNGGSLRYGSGMSVDVSSLLHAASLSAVRVDTNGNTVSWAASDGVLQALSCGVEKSGDGTLQLNWVASGQVYSRGLSVLGGELNICKVSGNGILAGSFSGVGTIALTSASGQLTISGDNSAFGGTVQLVGDGSANTGSVCFSTGAALGGADTQVKVAGQRFWFGTATSTSADIEIAEGTSTYFDGSTNRAYAFSGTVSGAGSLLVKPSCHITMSGDISSFTGQFIHPGAAPVTWTFGGERVQGSGLVQANLDSPGSSMTYCFQYENPTTMSGVVSGAANLLQRGSGALSLTGRNETSGTLSIESGCEVQLGSASAAGSWAGVQVLGAGQFTLVNGFLQNPLTTLETAMVADVAAGAVVDMAGMDGNVLQYIAVGADGLLRGISGPLNVGGTGGVESLYLTLGNSCIGYNSARADNSQYMLEITNGELKISDSAMVTLDMESIKSILSGQRQAVYLHLSNADIVLQNGISAADLFSNSATTPEALGLVVLGVEGGSLVLEGAVRDVYMVMQDGDYDTVNSYTRLQAYKATFVDTGYTLFLNLPGDNTQLAWVNNLLGTGDFCISNTDESAGVVRTMLNNAVLADLDSLLPPEQQVPLNGANTAFSGNISAGSAVQLVKTGTGTLTVGGALTADWLELDEGTLCLTGTGNSVHSLHGPASLALEGELEITGNALAFTGNLSGDGTLILKGQLYGKGAVGRLTGDGSLYSFKGGLTVRNVADAVFSGSLLPGQGAGVLTVLPGDGQFTLHHVRGSDAWTLQNAGQLVLEQSGQQGNASLTLGGLVLQSGSDTLILLNTDAGVDVFDLGFLSIADDAVVRLQSTGAIPLEPADDGTLVLGSVAAAELGNSGSVALLLGSGVALQGIESAWLSVENGLLLLNTRRDETNHYAAHAHSANGRAGAEMLWQLPPAVLRACPELVALSSALGTLLEQGRDAELDSLLAAAAGAGTAVLGAAVLGDMERQLRSIRNRTTSMGLNQQDEYIELPVFNAWVNAEADRRELRADGTAAGYTLSSWGTTVGADVDFSPTVTAGLALTGMYGELSTNSPDHTGGRMEQYYLSLLGRYIHHRWTHTWLGAFGWGDISLKRRVGLEAGCYRTRGNTDSVSFGGMYELGYVVPLDEDAQSCLQPVANISYRYAHVDSCTETGSDAALHIGRQGVNCVSFGLGARVQTYALENTMNRQSLLEARMLLKMDAGNRRGSAETALASLRSRSGRVHAARDGWVGMEMGTGITIPLGVDAGFLFLDAGFEFRADESEWNGTVGYRLSF